MKSDHDGNAGCNDNIALTVRGDFRFGKFIVIERIPAQCPCCEDQSHELALVAHFCDEDDPETEEDGVQHRTARMYSCVAWG